MDLKKAIVFVSSQIEGLEKSTYMFEVVIKPRYDRDVEILGKLREQHLKLLAFKEKKDAGEDIKQDDVYSYLPSQFR